jgi:hypothetical protein
MTAVLPAASVLSLIATRLCVIYLHLSLRASHNLRHSILCKVLITLRISCETGV